MERLLDPNQPFDVALFDSTVNAFYDVHNPNHQNAHKIIIALHDSPTAWQHVSQILDESTLVTAKFTAIQILENTIRYRWWSLPQKEGRDKIRTYVGALLVEKTKNPVEEKDRVMVSRLNLALVLILKQEWPHNWPNFIPEIVASARVSDSLCENNMLILQLLSESVFEFAMEELTQEKQIVMKKTLTDQFGLVYSLCNEILQVKDNPKLLTQTLLTMTRFVHWIPVGFIFETPLIDFLVGRFFPDQRYRNNALACLTETCSFTKDTEPYQRQLVRMMQGVVERLEGGMLPLSVNVAVEYRRVGEDDRAFVQRLALFFTTFVGNHLRLLELPENRGLLLKVMAYLVNISHVDNPELFKICLDAWSKLTADLYRSEVEPHRVPVQQMALANRSRGFPQHGANGHAGGAEITHPFDPSGDGVEPGDDHPNRAQQSMRKGIADDDDEDDNEDPATASASSATATLLLHRGRYGATLPETERGLLYKPILTQLRTLMITRMTRPEEVLVRRTEDGEVVRETTKDTDAISQYMQMRDTLVYLTHLDVTDTERQMLSLLEAQMEDQSVNCNTDVVNTLSWAIGSISGTMDELQEKQFLVAVVKDLLRLCERIYGKDHKALVASDIMYVVGKYPRFLSLHWKFLRTVCQKLFEFMHELHPGVQDMACDTFRTLARSCRSRLVKVQPGEERPFIDHLLTNLAGVTNDLEVHQIQSFYASVGVILGAETNQNLYAEYLSRLMTDPNTRWSNIMMQAEGNPNSLRNPQVMKEMSLILRLNKHVADTTGPGFEPQLSRMYVDVLNVYELFSNWMYQAVRDNAVQEFRAMRSVKTDILALFQSFIERTNQPQMVMANVVPNLLNTCLVDYARAPSAELRDPEVLSLLIALVTKLKSLMDPAIGRVLSDAVHPTLNLIAQNFEDYPEHRAHFYTLLKGINEYCFAAAWTASSPEEQKRMIHALAWGFKHTDKDVAQSALESLFDVMGNVQKLGDEVAQSFFSNYLVVLIQDLLVVLCDRLHKSGFAFHVVLLRESFSLVRNGLVKIPLFPTTDPQALANPVPFNGHMLTRFVADMISEGFPNVSRQIVDTFVQTMYEGSTIDLVIFKQRVRDFLISIKEFSAEDNTELYADETRARLEMERLQVLEQRRAVPGLVQLTADDMAEL